MPRLSSRESILVGTVHFDLLSEMINSGRVRTGERVLQTSGGRQLSLLVLITQGERPGSKSRGFECILSIYNVE